ncbi:MAG: hypothetical protein RLZZ242_526 [Bacteroidota bacterium]|jgi:uncharacterized protein (TIRG00374 family)
MKRASLSSLLKAVIPIAIGLGLVLYSYLSTPEEVRSQIYTYVTQADLRFVGGSLFLALLSHLSRAKRWNYLLEPMGYSVGLIPSSLFVLMAYFANLGIPRSGELLRASSLKTYEQVPFEKAFGTIVTERVIDLIMLFLIIGLAMLMQTQLIINLVAQNTMTLLFSTLFLIAAVTGLVFLVRLSSKANSSWGVRLHHFFKGIQEGLTSVLNMRQTGKFIAHTLFIWACYVGMFYVIKFTVPETATLGLSELLVAFIAGSFAMTATNGGVGLYPIAVRASLGLFGISFASGEAFGWIVWTSQTLMIVIFGAISFLSLPLWYSLRKKT